MDAMAATTRRTSSTIKKSLAEQIIESPEEFDLDQLIYIVESIRTNITPIGEGSKPSQEAVHIRGNLTMHHQGREINHLAVSNTPSTLPELYINTLNLAGINGPLPTPLTELLLDSLKNKDLAGLHFLDIFHHRLASMWHRLRKRTYPHLYQSLPENTPTGMVQQDLSGFKQQGDVAHTLFHDYFWRRSRSISGILQMIEVLFEVHPSATPFEGTWRTVDESQASKIGKKGQFQVLGKDAILGLRCWDQAAGFSIQINPLDWKTLQQFLPITDKKLGGSNFAKLKQLLISYLGSQPRVFLNLTLKPSANKGTTLKNQNFLGWNSWLTGTITDPVGLKLN